MSSSSTPPPPTTTSLYGSRFNPSVTSLPRPRRPDPSTISYITSLPLDDDNLLNNPSSSTTTNEDDDDDDDDVTSHPLFLASKNAVDSIANEIASLAGDERGCLFLERVVRLAVMAGDGEMMVVLMGGVIGYAVHLASHRYGSHYLQTLLSSTKPFLSKTTTTTTNTLVRHIGAINDELLPYATDLAVHICGSHVMRSLLTVLGGVDISSSAHPGQQRDGGGGGKKKKKKKTKKSPQAQERDGRNVIRPSDEKVTRLAYSPSVCVSFTEGLTKLFRTLTYGSNDDALASSFDPGPSLRDMICHVSAGPLYALKLTVLCVLATSSAPSSNDDNETGVVNPLITPSSPAHDHLSTLFSWSSQQPSTTTCQIMYDLIRHPVGSVYIERVFRYAPPSLHRDMLIKSGFYNDDNNTPNVKVFSEALSHDVANFVIQTIVTTLSHRTDAERVCRALLSDSHIKTILKQSNRRGVMWRIAECCARYTILQEMCLKVLFGDFDDVDAVSRMVTPWTGIINSEDQQRRRVDPTGARLIFTLLQFVPRLSRKMTSVVSSWDEDTLVFLAMDGMGSRYIIDGILCHKKVTTESSLMTAVRKLHERYKGHYVALATHRVGHHAVVKLFRLLSDERKEELVQELVEGGGGSSMRQLQSCAMGRSVMKECLLGEFVIDKATWRSQVKKLREKEDWLKDIVGGGEEKEGGNDGNEETKKKKRKRKRKAGKVAATVEGDDDNDGDIIDDANDDGKSKPTSSVVDSIVETLLSGRSSSQTMKGVSEGGDAVASKRKRKRKRKKSGA